MEIKQATCKRIDAEGMGIIEGVPIFDVLPGETIRFDPKTKRIVERMLASSDRVKITCPYFEQCGSCQFLHWSYDAQLKWKTEQVKQIFQSLRKLDVDECLGTSENFGYRGKNIISFKSIDRKVSGGYFAPKSHRLFDVESCLVTHPKAMEILLTIKRLAQEFKVEIYDEDRKTGLLRHAMVRISASTGEILVVLVVAHSQFKGRRNFATALRKKHPEITSIVENINDRSTSIVLGSEENIVFGKGYIVDRLAGYSFKISARSFYQVHPTQSDILYQTALKLADLKQTDRLLDAYSGVGTIGIIASKYVKEVICVESNKDAVNDARSNGQHNAISNIKFVCADAAQWLMDPARKVERIDVVVMDPPREGSSKEFLAALRKLLPRTILYISCNPETQVRDIKELLTIYDIQAIQPVDMFPQTSHIENIVVLKRRGYEDK
jgi:23S rRNA (uracil1939-C5)-methyltransferase